MANETINSVVERWYEDSYGPDSLICAVGNNIFSGGGGAVNGAMRFTSITLAQGQTVNFARLQYVYGGVGGSGTWKFICYGVKETNVSSGYPFGRTKTTANVVINEGQPTSGGTKTIDVGSILQEIVNDGGWSSGNAVEFIFEDNGSDSDVYAIGSSSSYLTYRQSATPNFKPTPTTVAAPSLPAAEDVGMLFSELGISAFDATDDECYLTTRKYSVKLLEEDMYTADAAETVSVPHGLGYVPFVTVFALENSPGAKWQKLNRNNLFEDHPLYYVDEDNLYLHSSEAGEKFYYRIFLDRIV